MTNIEWTDHTLNPGLYGCTAVSPACENCYAAGMALRLAAMPHTAERYAGAAKRVHGRAAWTGRARVDFDAIGPAFAKLPKRQKRCDDCGGTGSKLGGCPTCRGTGKRNHRVFVTSMSDLFHKDVPDAFIDRVFMAMARRPHLTFQVLTKRPRRLARWWDLQRERIWPVEPTDIAGDCPEVWPRNVWAGTTVEGQERADERVSWLLQVPAQVRFLSCEPLLGPVRLDQVPCRACGGRGWYDNGPLDQFKCESCDERGRLNTSGIDWVIAGGESGHQARPSNPAWFWSLRDQCAAGGVPFFFKQWGSWVGEEDCDGDPQGFSEQHPEDGGVPRHQWQGRPVPERLHEAAGRTHFPGPHSYHFGRGYDPKTLDGVEHRAFPEDR